jgi:hypothetical protein
MKWRNRFTKASEIKPSKKYEQCFEIFKQFDKLAEKCIICEYFLTHIETWDSRLKAHLFLEHFTEAQAIDNSLIFEMR